MKTIAEIVSGGHWGYDEYGFVMRFDGYELRIEPLLFGAWMLAVYEDRGGNMELIGEKFPVTVDTPYRNRMRAEEGRP